MKKALIFIALLLVLSTLSFAETESQDMEIFTMQHIDAASIFDVIDELKSDDGKVIVEPNTNSLIVVDDEKSMERIAQVIKRLDLKPKQVEVEVLVTDITAGFLQEIGISAEEVVIPSDRYEAVLNLVNTHSDAKVRTKMKVTTLSNKPARIQATVDEVFGDVVTRYNSGAEVTTPIIVGAGQNLEVLPRVNNDGTILVILRPSVSSFSEDGASIHQKAALTQVLINSGETIAIGGVNSSSKDSRRGSLPIVGAPISKGSNTTSQRVMIFLTATILD